jgi:hypothetical protein
LDATGKPGLEPHVHKPELIMVKVKVQVITAGLIFLQLRITGFFTITGTK